MVSFSVVYAIALASALMIWILVIPMIARWASARGSVLRVNLLPVGAVFFALIALVEGWTVVRGDTGQTRWMELYIAIAALFSLVSPLASLAQLALVIEEIMWVDELGGSIRGDGFVLAVLSTVLALLALALPIGYNCRPLHASLRERAMTLSLGRAVSPG